MASSVILARAADPGFETFLLRRNSRSAFAPGAYVFPGGTVDPSDAKAAESQTAGLEPDRLREAFRARVPAQLPTTQPPVDLAAAAALSVAALRELFEEAGVLLARTAGGDPVGAAAIATPEIEAARADVRNGRAAFADVLRARGWFADASALRLFSHWITPASEPRRYDTHFFLAIVPPDQAAVADADETHDGLWISPRAALDAYRNGTLHLVYPTIKHLERLAPFDSIDALRAFAAEKPVLTIEPSCAPDEGFVMPKELEGAW